jgi:hypothetical protein
VARRALVGCLVLAMVCGIFLFPGITHTATRPQDFLEGANAGEDVRAILVRACADCHSDLTVYPWYSALPFASGLIREDVERGREFLNFSTWDAYSRLRQQRNLTGIANQVRDRAMPLPAYLLLHPSARLSDTDIDTVFQWAQKERLRLITEGSREN